MIACLCEIKECGSIIKCNILKNKHCFEVTWMKYKVKCALTTKRRWLTRRRLIKKNKNEIQYKKSRSDFMNMRID